MPNQVKSNVFNWYLWPIGSEMDDLVGVGQPLDPLALARNNRFDRLLSDAKSLGAVNQNANHYE